MNAIRHWLLAATLLLGAASTAVAQDAPTQVPGAVTVDAQQVVDLIGKAPNLVILDNRHPADFGAGHIEGAVRLLDTDASPDALAKVVAAKDTPVLFYCNGLKCGRAAKAAITAVQSGYQQVYYYALGMEDWKKQGLPLVR